MDGRTGAHRDPREQPKPTPRLDLNPAAYRALARSKGWTTRDKASAALRIGAATISRARAGQGVPDNRTIAALLAAAKADGIPIGVALEQLFVLVEDDEEVEAAA